MDEVLILQIQERQYVSSAGLFFKQPIAGFPGDPLFLILVSKVKSHYMRKRSRIYLTDSWECRRKFPAMPSIEP
jgi:hypothetical protein